MGASFLNPLTGHWYEFDATRRTWSDAKAFAATKSYNGRVGYLATITSAAENNYIWKIMSSDAWVGGSDDYLQINAALGRTVYANQAAAEGKYYWVTGPEKGMQYSEGNTSPVTLAGAYANWNSREPNNAGSEHYTQLYSGNLGRWNDLANFQMLGTLIEYGDSPDDNVSNIVGFTREIKVLGAASGSITGGNINVCTGSNSTTLTLVGNSGAVVRWESSFDNFYTTGTTINNTTDTYTATNVSQTTYYRAIVSCGSGTVYTASVTLTVNATASGNVTAQNNSICAGGEVNLTLSGKKGDVVKWQISTDNSNWTDIANTSTNLIETLTTAGTYYYRAVVETAGCGAAVNSTAYPITVTSGTPPVGGTMSDVTYYGSTPRSGTLTLSGYTGTISKWQSSTNGGINWTDISNTADTYSYSNITTTTLYRAVLINGSCGTAYSSRGGISIFAEPTITSFSPITAGQGESVTITGTNFTNMTSVSFGGTAAASFTILSPTQIVAVVGAGSSGSVSVSNSGISASLSGFTFRSSFDCPEVDRRNNGNGQASSCAGVNGTPVATNVVGTAYATVPSTSKTGNITFRWQTLPSAIPVITKVWINGVQSTAEVGPPSVTTQQGGFYKIEYCFYKINLPNAGKYTLEFTDPQTGNVLGRCTFDGSSDVTTSEPTLTNDTTPPVITGPNGSGTTTATTSAKSIVSGTTAVGNFSANESITWSLSGVDAAKFSLAANGDLSFNTAPNYELPSDTDANNQYIVAINAEDIAGNTSVQTLTVTILKDSDGDGTADADDTDDDNDGLPDTDELDCSASTGVSNTVDPSPFYFVQWNSYVNGELKGTIDVAGTVVNVTVTNSSNSILQYRDNPYGGTADWGPTPTGNPFNSTFRSVTLGEHKFVFDRPVNNPRFFINSLNRTLDLSQPGIILKSNGRFTGTPTGTTTSVLVGNEANGTISFNGNLTQVSFTGREYEMYCNFSLGLSSIADYSSCVDKDTDGDGLPDRLDIESDGDGVTDAQELADGTNYTDPCSFVLDHQTMSPDAAWNAADCDGDGVTNLAEKNRGSNPLIADIAPVITGPNGNATTTGATSSKSVAENATAVVYTFTASKTVTWSLDGGEDAAKFSMNTTTGALTFLSAPDFEIPTDGSTSGTNTYIVIIKATDIYGLTKSQTLTVTVTNVNEVPSDIALSASSIDENNAANATVGSLSSTDVDAGDTHTYNLVSGTGSTDNATFAISGTSLKVNTALDFETKSSYSIRVKTTDAGGLTYEKQFTITVTDVNEVPTNIALSASSIAENNAANATVGSLSSTDVDAGDTHTYTLVSGIGSTDNATFAISGTSLKVNTSLDFEAKSSYSIRVKTTDVGGLSYEKVFTITVTNVNEAPTNIATSQTAIYEANANGATVSNLSSTDPDAGDTFTYTLVSGIGSTDNASFSISGNQLKANSVFVFKTKSTYSIRLRTTDAGGLSYEKVFSISVLESPLATGTGNVLGTSTITAASNNVTISKGYSAPLRVTGIGLVTYSWSPSTGLSSTNIANPIASPTQTTVYAVTVSNTMGLSTTVYVTVNVVEDYNITPNNVLTPNGDGVNDKWVIGNLSSYPNNQVQIFDRAGRLLYVQSNYQNEWDGTINGVPLNEDTYYFVINFGSGVNPKKGFITIVRQ